MGSTDRRYYMLTKDDETDRLVALAREEYAGKVNASDVSYMAAIRMTLRFFALFVHLIDEAFPTWRNDHDTLESLFRSLDERQLQAAIMDALEQPEQ